MNKNIYHGKFANYVNKANNSGDIEREHIKKKLIAIGLFFNIMGISAVILGIALFMSPMTMRNMSAFDFNMSYIIIGMAIFMSSGFLFNYGSAAKKAASNIYNINKYSDNDNIHSNHNGNKYNEHDINNKIKYRNCPNCGDEIDYGENFCDKCGTFLKEIAKNICECGVENDIESKYCKSCGRKIF